MKKTLIIIPALILVFGAVAWLNGQGIQTIPTPVATPGVVVVNTSTQVKFTLNLSATPSVIPTSVNLLRLSSTGAQTIVATMKDDGTSGDAVGGDKIFTAAFALNETQPGTFGFQASVAFPGQLRRVLSSVLQFAALAPPTIPVVLPPDPGPAGNASLAGVDSDHDGVRDDVQRFIVFAYPGSEKKRTAALQYAKAAQFLLLASNNEQQSISNMQSYFRAADCLDLSIEALGGTYGQGSDALKPQILNTYARAQAFYTADSNNGGETFKLPPISQKFSQCDVNPSILPN